MTVAQFLAKFALLQKRGPAEVAGSPEPRQIQAELKAVADRYRAEVAAFKAARVDPRSRLPLTGQAGVNASDLVAAGNAPPSDQQAQTMRAAFDRYMDLPFACPA